jgi:hypothetical protein
MTESIDTIDLAVLRSVANSIAVELESQRCLLEDLDAPKQEKGAPSGWIQRQQRKEAEEKKAVAQQHQQPQQPAKPVSVGAAAAAASSAPLLVARIEEMDWSKEPPCPHCGCPAPTRCLCHLEAPDSQLLDVIRDSVDDDDPPVQLIKWKRPPVGFFGI